MPVQSEQSEIEREQAYLAMLHSQVDIHREKLARELAEVLREPAETAQAQAERGAAVGRLNRRLAAFDAAEHGLCFGRLDSVDGGRRYLGRIGVRGAEEDEEPLLIDWRAPAARAFYTATAAAPQGVRLRRHLHTRERRVVRVDDELLDGTAPAPADMELCGEAALLAALRAERTGRMRDVVATLQTEQDRIIRSPHAGVMVVQGGPGTGKTVVALHRAAYLLYSHPRLDERGVLVVGPNPVFLSYISQVLPGLGETSVLLSTVGELFPGVTALEREDAAVAEVKGRLVMAEVLAAAVRARQAEVGGPVEVIVEGEPLSLEPELLIDAAERARADGLPHNLARPVFCRIVIEELARRMAGVVAGMEEQIEADLAGRIDSAALEQAVAKDLAGLFGQDAPPVDRHERERAEFEEAERAWLKALPYDPQVRALLEWLWPALTPQRLLEELFADPRGLAEAAPQLTPAERELLLREPGGGWTPADVPLLDEAAELLGEDRRAERARQARERARQIEYAQGVLDIARGSRSGEDENDDEAELLSAADLLDAELFAGRHEGQDLRTVAERAAADRTWAFGHVIVDEAQEVPPMAWRLLVRRCPTRSFTVVGDMAQSGQTAGARSWTQALEPFFGTRWRLERLTVNYRTSAEVMSASDRVLTAIHPDLEPARAVRAGGVRPWRARAEAADLPARLAGLAAREAAAGTGSVAVITPREDLARLAEAVRAAVPDASWGREPDLERRVVVLTARQSKGLEFDSVVLADPQAVLDGSSHGLNDLYVALTRATERLAVLHPGPVPPVLEHLEECEP
ncbi:HelD family protein [Streptosporangium sp. NPDC049376]|uniref:HelD family protein n=1 Tax=Streptosporangium sp. NPDC049376 TaxID=3366192 RepID=UPI0037885E03